MMDRRHRIRERAYEFWEAKDRQHGNDLAHWFRAEAEIPLRVTFDSNVWEDVVCPARCDHDKIRQTQAIRVRNAIEARKLTGLFCEAWATLEGVTKQDRPDFHADQSIKPQLGEAVLPDGTSGPAVFMGPDQSHRPPLESCAAKRLDEAISLGLRLLMVPRDSGLNFAADFYVPHTEQIADRTCQALAAIEQRGVGRAMIRAFGLELARRYGPSNRSITFSDIPPDFPMTQADRKKIGLLVAEWADGEAVAAHIGYHNDIFCSEDFKSGGGKSVLDPAHRTWLTQEFGVQFATLTQLAEIVAS